MVPWASDRLFDDKTANKWRAVVRAERTNGEQSAGAPDKQDGFAACMALQHGSFGKCRKRNAQGEVGRSEEHTSELPSLMRISYAVFVLKKKKTKHKEHSMA